MKNAESFGFLVHDVARLLRRQFEARASQYGLSAAQWRLLVHVVREERATQARLAELLEIEPISVSRLIDRMEQGGWVERLTDENDRRVRLVTPTAKSREAMATIKAVAGDVYDVALAGLSADDRKRLMADLNRVVANLSDDFTCDGDGSVERPGMVVTS